MYRYFVLIWTSDDPRAEADAKLLKERLLQTPHAWSHVVDNPGFAAFHGTGRDDITSWETRAFTEPSRGVIFGRAFRRGQELVPHAYGEAIDAPASSRICSSGGEHLIDEYWGRYIAFFRDGSSGEICALRDPSGGLPCFVTHYGGVRVVFSDIESCVALRLFTFTINWRYAASYLVRPGLQIRETGLNEVIELLPGERACFTSTGINYSLLWKPAEIASSNRIIDPSQAIAAVREGVRQCVHAWASLHRSVAHCLSGGLDSSIVLGCLKSAPNEPRVTCIHYFASATHEDEREYARLVAKRMDADLVECELDPSAASLEKLWNVRSAPKPWSYIYDLIHSPIEMRVTEECGATALFSGGGGDGLFAQSRTQLAIADYLTELGFRRGVFRVAHDAARISRVSIWSALREGFYRYLQRGSPGTRLDFGDAPTVIPRNVIENVHRGGSLEHPWIVADSKLPPGLRWQILGLCVPEQFYESFGGATELERTSVLVSQPLMELCLRIPTYTWITGGRDRAIARRAFADVLPDAVVRRTQKGAINRYNRKLADENLSFMRDMLLDGLLVNAGLLDRHALETFLRHEMTSASFEYNDVLYQHLCTEVWLRKWSAFTTSSSP